MARSARRRRQRSSNVVGILLIVFGLASIFAFVFAYWWVKSSKEPLDATLCPVRGGPRAIHVVMIDRSDPISGQQAQRIRQHMIKIKGDAGFGTRFDIYTFEGDVKNEMIPILSICAPGRAEEANRLIENPERIERKYSEQFSEVLDRTINDLLKETTRPNSPIIESMRAAAVTSFGAVDPGKLPLRLTLISDMIQHTAYSHLRSEPNFEQLAKMSSWPAMRPSLRGATVQILYLLRLEVKRGSAPVQNRGHQLFWEQLIDKSGGRLTHLESF